MVRAPVETRLRKEFRAILPAFAAAALSVLAMGMDDSRQIGASLVRGFAAAGFFISIVAIGALSIGHEYGYRTLAGLLAQPIDRRRLLLTKLAVAVAAILGLAGVAWLTMAEGGELTRGLGMPRSFARSDAEALRLAMIGLPVLCALCLAPWLTMLCRNPMAGIVFTIAVPGLLWLAGEVAAVTKYGVVATRLPGAASELRFAVFSWGMAAAVIVGPVAGWLIFMRLQALDGGHTPLRLPRWLERLHPAAAAGRRTRHSWVWLVLRKEWRFQHLTLVVSAFYSLGWLLIFVIRKRDPDFQHPIIYGMTLLQVMLIPLLAGSLASAEERQLGTAEWQALLPVAPWKTWCIKAGVALGLALALGLGLPALLNLVWPSDDMQLLQVLRGGLRRPFPEYVLRTSATILAVATLSLYVSSLSRGGMRALLTAIPAVIASWLGLMSLSMLDRTVFGNFTAAPLLSSRGWWQWWELGVRWIYSPRWPLTIALAAIVVGGLVALLRYAMINHRSAERGSPRVIRQLATLGAAVAIALTVWTSAFAYYRAPRVEQIEEVIRRSRERYERLRDERRAPELQPRQRDETRKPVR
jgi:hypothetical protein